MQKNVCQSISQQQQNSMELQVCLKIDKLLTSERPQFGRSLTTDNSIFVCVFTRRHSYADNWRSVLQEGCQQ